MDEEGQGASIRARRLVTEGLVLVASILVAFALDASWQERELVEFDALETMLSVRKP